MRMLSIASCFSRSLRLRCQARGFTSVGIEKVELAVEKGEKEKVELVVEEGEKEKVECGLVAEEGKKAVVAEKDTHAFVDASWSSIYNSYFLASVYCTEKQGIRKPYFARVLRRSGSAEVPPFRTLYSENIYGSHEAEMIAGVECTDFFLNTDLIHVEKNSALFLNTDHVGAQKLLYAAAQSSKIINPQDSWNDRALHRFRSSIIKSGVAVSVCWRKGMMNYMWLAHRFANFRFEGDEMLFGPQDIAQMEELQMLKSPNNKKFYVYFDIHGFIGVLGDSQTTVDITSAAIKSHGGTPGEIAEIVDPSPDANQVLKGLKKLALDVRVKAIIINLGGGGTPQTCEVLAHRLVDVFKLGPPTLPIFVNFHGKKVADGKRILKAHGLVAPLNVDDAVHRALESMR